MSVPPGLTHLLTLQGLRPGRRSAPSLRRRGFPPLVIPPAGGRRTSPVTDTRPPSALLFISVSFGVVVPTSGKVLRSSSLSSDSDPLLPILSPGLNIYYYRRYRPRDLSISGLSRPWDRQTVAGIPDILTVYHRRGVEKQLIYLLEIVLIPLATDHVSDAHTHTLFPTITAVNKKPSSGLEFLPLWVGSERRTRGSSLICN